MSCLVIPDQLLVASELSETLISPKLTNRISPWFFC